MRPVGVSRRPRRQSSGHNGDVGEVATASERRIGGACELHEAPVIRTGESRRCQAPPAHLATVEVHGRTPAGGSVLVAEALRSAIDASVYAAVLQTSLRSSRAAF